MVGKHGRGISFRLGTHLTLLYKWLDCKGVSLLKIDYKVYLIQLFQVKING